MSSKPPFIAQERADTCMLACLRMILASQGIEVTEAELLAQMPLELGGIDPDQLAEVAGNCGLIARPRQLTLDEMVKLVRRERFPIVLVDRSILDDVFSVHAVIPYRFTRAFVRVLDPLRGERLIAIRKFDQATRRVDRWAVTWSLPTE